MRTLFDVSTWLDRRREHWILALMLWTLHAATQSNLGTALAQAWMTAHLGLFFLWQPIWQREQRLNWPALTLITVFTVSFVGTLNAWWLFAWLILLIGIVTGRARTARRDRHTSMLALAFLVSELLTAVVPRAFAVGEIEPIITDAFSYGLYILPLVIGLIPVAGATQQTYPIDFFRGIIVALLTALMAVGSVLLTVGKGFDYPAALFVSLLALAGFLIVISWLTAPGAGTGLAVLWEKSVLNIGTPFDAWMARLATVAAREAAPEDFLRAAMDELTQTPWIAGVAWRRGEQSALSGVETPRTTQIEAGWMTVKLFLHQAPGPTLLLHCRLLIETLGYFFAAKQREQEHAHQAHLKAVYATGARLTHDIKNLLQSLKLLATASTASGRDDEYLSLARRQLPLITQRLQNALDKLNKPVEDTGDFVPLAAWWTQFRARHTDGVLLFAEQIAHGEMPVPAECFDSVLENLLDNARMKRTADPTISISVEVRAEAGAITISVTDSGAPVPEAMVCTLFRQVVSAPNGLGIGLYQAAQYAERHGFRLRLARNLAGEVCFVLANVDHLP